MTWFVWHLCSAGSADGRGWGSLWVFCADFPPCCCHEQLMLLSLGSCPDFLFIYNSFCFVCTKLGTEVRRHWLGIENIHSDLLGRHCVMFCPSRVTLPIPWNFPATFLTAKMQVLGRFLSCKNAKSTIAMASWICLQQIESPTKKITVQRLAFITWHIASVTAACL